MQFAMTGCHHLAQYDCIGECYHFHLFVDTFYLLYVFYHASMLLLTDTVRIYRYIRRLPFLATMSIKYDLEFSPDFEKPASLKMIFLTN